ncbi:MAG: hypothetical protein ACLTBR_11510, partial [Anaerostipes sp.]
KKIIRHVDAMLKFLSVFTGDQDYEKLKLSKDQGGINMCVVLQEAIERGRKQGIECGKKEGIEFGIREGIERGKREGIEFGIREGIERGKREGIEFGIQQGRADAMLEIASGMLRKNISIKDICELTGLSKEQVRTLKL